MVSTATKTVINTILNDIGFVNLQTQKAQINAPIPPYRRTMESKRRETLSSSRRSRKSYDSESDSESFSDDSRDSSRRRSSGKSRERSRSQGRTSRRHRTPDDSSDSGRDRKRKKSSSRKITEEEIAEYLGKKAQRKAMKAAKKLKTQSMSGYSNDSNPFGDSNLNEKFVWRKKIERDVSQGVPLDMFSVKAEKKKQIERM
ncbi:hypothetical protein OIU74_029269, partial [Salix koriyanagi]